MPPSVVLSTIPPLVPAHATSVSTTSTQRTVESMPEVCNLQMGKGADNIEKVASLTSNTEGSLLSETRTKQSVEFAFGITQLKCVEDSNPLDYLPFFNLLFG